MNKSLYTTSSFSPCIDFSNENFMPKLHMKFSIKRGVCQHYRKLLRKQHNKSAANFIITTWPQEFPF